MSANKSFYRIEKPIGTIYSDYVIKDGKCFAVFEKNDGRVETKKVCETTKTNINWREFYIIETKKYLFIDLGN